LIFDNKRRGIIINWKILLWRIKLGAFSHVIKYWSEEKNVAPEVFPRVCARAHFQSSLTCVHGFLCHPDVTKLMCCYFVRHFRFLMWSRRVNRVVYNRRSNLCFTI